MMEITDVHLLEAVHVKCLTHDSLNLAIPFHLLALRVIFESDEASCGRFNDHIEILLSLGVALVEGRHFFTVINVYF